MALTKKEKAQVVRAFEKILSGKEEQSCIALRNVDRKGHTDDSEICQVYGAFWGFEPGDSWDFSVKGDDGNQILEAYDSRANKQARLLMLATFYVLG